MTAWAPSASLPLRGFPRFVHFILELVLPFLQPFLWELGNVVQAWAVAQRYPPRGNVECWRVGGLPDLGLAGTGWQGGVTKRPLAFVASVGR